MDQQQIDPKLASIIIDAVDDSDESDFDEIISHLTNDDGTECDLLNNDDFLEVSF